MTLFIVSQAVDTVLDTVSHTPVKNSFTALSLSMMACFMLSVKSATAPVNVDQTSEKNFVIASQFLIARTTSAIAAAIAAITGRAGAIAAMTGAIIGAIRATSLITAPMPVLSLPTAIRTGPMAATATAILAMVCFWESSRLLNQSTSPCIFSATLAIVGARASPKEVTATSILDFSFSREPPKPDIIAPAISDVVPVFPSAVFSSETSSGAVLISASHGAIWFLPKMADAAAICSDSDSPANASCRSFWTVMLSFMEPSVLVTLIPRRSIHAAPSFAGDTSRASPVFREFALTEASMLLSAMTPMNSAASLTVYPAVLNTGAATPMELARPSTFKAELLHAFVKTSA